MAAQNQVKKSVTSDYSQITDNTISTAFVQAHNEHIALFVTSDTTAPSNNSTGVILEPFKGEKTLSLSEITGGGVTSGHLWARSLTSNNATLTISHAAS